jgi:hypothetical protein
MKTTHHQHANTKLTDPKHAMLRHSSLLASKSLRGIFLASTAVGLLALAVQSLPHAFAQSTAVNPQPGQCVLAGRLDGDAQWAPRFKNLELLDIEGKVIQPRVANQQSAKDLLATVKQVRVNAPALLSTCNGNQAIPKGDDQASQAHTEAPAVSAGKALIAVEAISYPPLGLGGEWVELKLALQQERVTMISSRRSKP